MLGGMLDSLDMNLGKVSSRSLRKTPEPDDRLTQMQVTNSYYDALLIHCFPPNLAVFKDFLIRVVQVGIKIKLKTKSRAGATYLYIPVPLLTFSFLAV